VSFTFLALALALALFLGMLTCIEVGRLFGSRPKEGRAEASHAGVGVVEGSVFGLLGLMLAFTFSGAARRFDDRRHLIVEEVNAIGTAWKRIDMLPPDAQPEIRDGFRRYVDANIAAYRKLPDLEAEEFAKADHAANEVWAKAAAASRPESGVPARMLLILPAMNEMFDIAQARRLATRIHPPAIIYVMLAIVALAAALLAGYGMAGDQRRSWLHMIAFSLTIAASAYVILDLEYPRLGLIRVERFDRALLELRATMK
jgi:hypothetical protein